MSYFVNPNRMTRWITTMGAALMAEVGRLGRTGMFLGQTLLYCLTPPVKGERVLRQIWFIGWKSMLVIALTGTFTGMVVALQGFPTLRRVGSEALLGPMVALRWRSDKLTQFSSAKLIHPVDAFSLPSSKLRHGHFGPIRGRRSSSCV